MSKSTQAEMARDLSEGIASGRFPVGSLLPTELELCERYGASRYAVRAVMQDLQDVGLISRRKNVGTRVEASRPASGFTQSVSTVDELAQFGATHVRVVRSVDTIVADLVLAKELGCPGGTRWIRISSLRMDEGKAGRPIGWTDVYVDEAYAEIVTLVHESPGTLISSLIETRYGRRIARIRQDIEATNVPRAMAEALRVEAGSSALKIVRRYLDSSGIAFEVSVSIHPAERFVFSMEMDRSKP